MSTIIRVKRRCDEEPQDIIIVNCKKRKTSEETLDSSDKTPTVLQLAGTVKNQEDDVLKHCKTSLKENIETDIKKKTHQNVFQSIRDRVREECIQNSKENRYKVVNLCRSNSHNDDGVTIVDVEADKMVEDVETKPQYVYDLYYTISDDLGEIYDHDLVGVYPLSNELVYGSHRDNGAADSDDDESEDSNAENNWRNEYPDEDEYRDDNSITEDDMISAMQHVHLDKDDLSSDDENAGFIYSIDSEAAGFEEDIDESDVNRYGERYALFKARYKKSERDSSVDDEDFYYEYDDDANGHEEEAHSSYY